MRFFQKVKDGGPESPVDAYFLFEIKNLISVAVLKFNEGRRENFHTHAFNAYTWFLSGELYEETIDGSVYRYTKSIFPKITRREKNHRVLAKRDSWCFTVRGPWKDTWTETNPENKEITTLTHGRKII